MNERSKVRQDPEVTRKAQHKHIHGKISHQKGLDST